MSGASLAIPRHAGTFLLGAALVAVAAPAWLLVVRDASTMAMPGPGARPSLAEGTDFVLRWGVMMAAMMLPSAAPMILLYRTVRERLGAAGERAVPAAAFAAVYLLGWLAFGVPVYAGYVAVGALAARWPAFDAVAPYLVAAVLVAAGVYQLTGAKRACLRRCASPLEFLMGRWRSGYGPTLRLAAEHAGYCVGCCWGLMAVLVAAGAMGIWWAAGIAVVVFAEKVAPRGRWTPLVVGVLLIGLGLAVALHPGLAHALRGRPGAM